MFDGNKCLGFGCAGGEIMTCLYELYWSCDVCDERWIDGKAQELKETLSIDGRGRG